MNEIFLWLMLAVASLILLSSLDDLFVDLLSIRRLRENLGFRSATREQPDIPGPEDPDRPHIGIFVASWREQDVLAQMVRGNLSAISYAPLKIFLGVYPNDAETRDIALKLAKTYPDRVQVIVNRLNGPTSKGQMLNEMFQQLFNDTYNKSPDIVVLHDSEDIIDPYSLDVYAVSKYADFIQIPVFSLDVSDSTLVAGTYMDEFAERHTREMFAREAVGAAIPSAGVGTGLSKELICELLITRGHVLLPGSVTEDYILGTEIKRIGCISTFSAIYTPKINDRERLIATLEYFPSLFWDSVKQKTRWTYGIVFEGTKVLGWRGSSWDKYFLFRDRKGAFINILPPFAFLMLLFMLAGFIEIEDMPAELNVPFNMLMVVNGAAILWRLYVRVKAFREIYGRWEVTSVLARWIIAVLINFVATVRAWRIFLFQSGFATRPIVWSKTQHRLPENFGAT